MPANADTTNSFALDYFSSLKRIDVGKGQLIEGRANGRTTAECPPFYSSRGLSRCLVLWLMDSRA